MLCLYMQRTQPGVEIADGCSVGDEFYDKVNRAFRVYTLVLLQKLKARSKKLLEFEKELLGKPGIDY